MEHMILIQIALGAMLGNFLSAMAIYSLVQLSRRERAGLDETFALLAGVAFPLLMLAGGAWSLT